MLQRAAVPWVPKRYQREGVRFLLTHGGAGLFFDPGLGKTATVLEAFRFLHAAGTCRRMLIVAPLRVCYSVWPNEVAKWRNFNGLTTAILHGPKKEAALHENADIFLINPEGLDWLCQNGRLAKLNPDILCIDESTKFKNTQSQRFKLIKPFLPHFHRRWILTGTPAPNGLLDIFGQIYLLDLGHALGPYITRYRADYFEPCGYGGYSWALKEGAEERIYKKVSPLVLRMDEKDWLDLPELVFNDVMVDLPPKARRVYTEVHTELLSLLEDGTAVKAASVGAALNKCLQITNGGVYTHVPGEMRCTHALHTAKTDALLDILEELQGQPALVLYSYGHDKDRLKAALGDVPCVSDMSAARSNELFDEWNRGRIPIMLGQPQSMGHGLNLQGGGQHMIWYGLPWDLEVYQQTVKRLHRQGSAFRSIFVHHILAKNTVDINVRATLQSKTKTQRALLDAIKSQHHPTL